MKKCDNCADLETRVTSAKESAYNDRYRLGKELAELTSTLRKTEEDLRAKSREFDEFRASLYQIQTASRNLQQTMQQMGLG